MSWDNFSRLKSEGCFKFRFGSKILLRLISPNVLTQMVNVWFIELNFNLTLRWQYLALGGKIIQFVYSKKRLTIVWNICRIVVSPIYCIRFIKNQFLNQARSREFSVAQWTVNIKWLNETNLSLNDLSYFLCFSHGCHNLWHLLQAKWFIVLNIQMWIDDV